MFLRNVSNFYQTAQRYVPEDNTLYLLVSWLVYSSALKIEAMYSFETSVTIRLHSDTSPKVYSPTLKMEAVYSCETSVTSTRLHNGVSQKIVCLTCYFVN
jgi:hypothetical protein